MARAGCGTMEKASGPSCVTGSRVSSGSIAGCDGANHFGAMHKRCTSGDGAIGHVATNSSVHRVDGGRQIAVRPPRSERPPVEGGGPPPGLHRRSVPEERPVRRDAHEAANFAFRRGRRRVHPFEAQVLRGERIFLTAAFRYRAAEKLWRQIRRSTGVTPPQKGRSPETAATRGFDLDGPIGRVDQGLTPSM